MPTAKMHPKMRRFFTFRRRAFAWGFGIATFGTGLLFGCLRDATGTIVAGAVTHSVLDVLAKVPTLLS